jgi:hypothetical protein
MNIFLSIFHLLQFFTAKQKLNPNNYSEQEIIMSYFPQTNEHVVHMYAKMQDLKLHGFL